MTALGQDHPFALHYPRDPGFGLPAVEPAPIPVGRGRGAPRGQDLLFVGFGPIVARAVEAADALAADGWSSASINARFAKPLDRELILTQARGKRLVVTFEESVVTGGFGSGVLEAIEEAAWPSRASARCRSGSSGSPATRFVDHGSVADLRRVLRLDAAGLAEQVRETLAHRRPAAATERGRRPGPARLTSPAGYDLIAARVDGTSSRRERPGPRARNPTRLTESGAEQ